MDNEWSSVTLESDDQEDDENTIEIEVKDTQKEEEEELVTQEDQQIETEVEVLSQQIQDEAPIEPTPADKPKELEGIKTKGAEKRIKQLIRQRKERDEQLERLKEELGVLKNQVNQKDVQLSSSLRHNIDSHESQLESTIETAKHLYKQAVEAGDTDGMLQAQESLSKTYAEVSQVAQRKQAWEEYNRTVEQSNQEPQVQQQEATPEHDPKAIEWASKNKWFGEDQIMTAAALTVDKELKNEGYDPSDDDFYEAVDVRLRQKYPDRFQVEEQETPRLQDTTTNSAQVVAGASRTPKTSSNGRNKVKLSQEDVRLANKWGIPLETYAAQKLKVEQAEGEYTSIYN